MVKGSQCVIKGSHPTDFTRPFVEWHIDKKVGLTVRRGTAVRKTGAREIKVEVGESWSVGIQWQAKQRTPHARNKSYGGLVYFLCVSPHRLAEEALTDNFPFTLPPSFDFCELPLGVDGESPGPLMGYEFPYYYPREDAPRPRQCTL